MTCPLSFSGLTALIRLSQTSLNPGAPEVDIYAKAATKKQGCENEWPNALCDLPELRRPCYWPIDAATYVRAL